MRWTSLERHDTGFKFSSFERAAVGEVTNPYSGRTWLKIVTFDFGGTGLPVLWVIGLFTSIVLLKVRGYLIRVILCGHQRVQIRITDRAGHLLLGLGRLVFWWYYWRLVRLVFGWDHAQKLCHLLGLHELFFENGSNVDRLRSTHLAKSVKIKVVL